MSHKASGKLRLKRHDIDSSILKQAKKEGNIVFGSQALKRKLGIGARRPTDWDLFSKTPKRSALKQEMKLDKKFRQDVFFTKKGTNPGTYKVKHKGDDLIASTSDDIGIVDYTKTPKPQPETFKFRGVKYRNLKEELAAKKRLVKNPEFKFRRQKDLEDIKRIKRYGNIK